METETRTQHPTRNVALFSALARPISVPLESLDDEIARVLENVPLER